MFRQLSEEETRQFQEWARANYIPGTEINMVWHPVVQAECRRINGELESHLSKGSGAGDENGSQ